MFLFRKLIRIFVIVSCLCLIGVTTTQAESGTNNQNVYPNWGQTAYPGMGGTYHPMFNPSMWMNPMTWMNPGNYMSLMHPGVWMNPGNYMQMMNPMAYMNMMYPMMGMMGPMMNPMGTMGMPGMPGMGAYGGYPMGQMPGGQMMDPKQYEDWFKQWTEMMNNMTPQTNQ